MKTMMDPDGLSCFTWRIFHKQGVISHLKVRTQHVPAGGWQVGSGLTSILKFWLGSDGIRPALSENILWI